MMVGIWVLSVAVIFGCVEVEGYTNYTVGDKLGWYDKLMKPGVDYAKWAEGKNFSLGDFLIFNTDTNHTVIQTYNSTTYKACDSIDADTDDTIEWSTGNPSTEAKPATVAVPLVKEGINYFFSGDYDGFQCSKGGQRFQITVAHGQGLPPSLSSPPPQAPAPDDEDADSTPVTNVPLTAVPQGSNTVDESGTPTDSNNNNHLLPFHGLGFVGLASVLGLQFLIGYGGLFQ